MLNKKVKSFSVTNPIFYPNGRLHIGHATTLVISNVLANYESLINNKEIRMSSGVDENGQKLVEAAEKEGKNLNLYLNEMSDDHLSTLNGLGINYTDFIRTTEKRHHEIVKDVLDVCYNRGDIYKGDYEGLYCVGCESYMKESDLVDGKCPDHKKEPLLLKEENYFFNLKKYETWLEEFYDSNNDFIVPNERANEIHSFIDKGLENFSISRANTNIGVKMPFDSTHSTYIWFDALFNYYTTIKKSKGGNVESTEFIDETNSFFPPDVQVLGKDILRFHAIYWPAMLASYFNLGEKDVNGILHYSENDRSKLPGKLLVTGMLKVEGEKISKSLGNAIDPIDIIKEFGIDLLVNYLLYSFSIGDDANYKKEDSIGLYNANLANNLGNLESRVLGMFKKAVDSGALTKELNNELELSFQKSINDYNDKFLDLMGESNLREALLISFEFCSSLNQYINIKEPWKLIKDSGNSDSVSELSKILYTVLFGLNKISYNLEPFFPKKMKEMRTRLGMKNNVFILGEIKGSLFERIKL